MNRKPNILIVDDGFQNRQVLQLQLEALGYASCEAADGVEALAVLERQPVDIVISDILMPRMDGYRLCQELRQRPALAQIPVLLYTNTYLAPADEKLALRSGADRYLVKPAPLATLRQTLAELLGTPRPAPPLPPPREDPAVMREYNAVLIQKLEEKSRELEIKNEELARVNVDLEESRARAAGIIESAMDAVITLDEGGGIVFFNRAAEAMFGTTAAAMMTQPIERLLPPALRAPSLATALRWDGPSLSSEELKTRGAFAGRRADGEEFPVEASVSRIDVAGRKLVTVILRDVTERHRAEEELRQASVQLRALALRIENIREQERTRIAREIHDVLAQELTRLKIELVWLAKRAAKPIDEPTRTAIDGHVKASLAQTDTAISTVQRIATELRPVILDSLGLAAAADWLAEDFARRTGLRCQARTPGEDLVIDRDRATALFRILQESLTNIARHAEATAVEIQLGETDGIVTLSVADNGRGISAAELADPLSIGLAGMRERASAFGGTVSISAAPAGGTIVCVQLPLEQDPPAAS